MIIVQHAYLVAHVLSGVSGDVMIHYGGVSLTGLMYISAIRSSLVRVCLFHKFVGVTVCVYVRVCAPISMRSVCARDPAVCASPLPSPSRSSLV